MITFRRIFQKEDWKDWMILVAAVAIIVLVIVAR